MRDLGPRAARWVRGALNVRDLLPGRVRLNPTQLLVATGIAVGVGAGLGAVAFRYLIQFFTYCFFSVLQPALATRLGPASVVPLPALGGLLFGPLIYFFAREAKGHGVPEVMLAVAERGGRIRPVVAVVKSLASALCIGSGGSVGREGPIVQIGSALGSTLGQVLRMPDDRIRTLVACGAAGGIAATFNAPIAGVFFALEVILGEFTTRAFGVVVIASVTASVIGRSVFGDHPAFPVPAYQLVHVGEFGLYALLAVIAGLAGLAFTHTLYWFEDRFDAIAIPEFLKPLPGGLLLGGIGLFLPQVFGVGYPAMAHALAGNYALTLLAALTLAKIIAVSLTIGSGGSGGVFAPSLFIGAMLGSAFGAAAGAVFPGAVAAPGAYGLVGMGAVFAGAARAPITAVIIMFELTGDYRIILPLMIAVAISTLISEALSRDTIYTLKLRRRGIDLHAGRDVDIMGGISVAAAMAIEVPFVQNDASVAEAQAVLERAPYPALVLLDESGDLDGIVSVRDVEQALLDNEPGLPVANIASRPVLTAFSDESLAEAIRQMDIGDVAQLPVVERAAPAHVIGLLRRHDIVRAYSHRVRDQIETRLQRPLQQRELRGAQLVEVRVPRHSALASQTLANLAMPAGALIVTIDRDHQTLVPRRDTVLAAGDQLRILVDRDVVTQLHEYLSTVGGTGGTAAGS